MAKNALVNQVTVQTDAAYKALFKTDVKYYKVTCSTTPQECMNDPSKVAMTEVDQDEAKRNGKVLAVNGILNGTERAGQLAYQNAPVDKNLQKPDEIHLIHIPPASSNLAEVLVAGYEQMLAPILGYSNADVAYAQTLQGRGQDPTLSLGHSRGTIVQTNAFGISADAGYRNPNLATIGVGVAVSQQSYLDATTSVSSNPEKVDFIYMRNDPVSVIAARNPGDAAAAIKEFWNVMFSRDGLNNSDQCSA
jgi:filamentous hemagglutinin